MEVASLLNIAGVILALAVAIIGHEIMHGLSAYKYGDVTAKIAGRLSINPIVHIDIVGTIIVPAVLFFSGAPFLFGWAKPVPVNIKTVLNNGGYNGAIAVSLAGIAYNFFLAAVFSLLLVFFKNPNSIIQLFLFAFIAQSIIYNTVLGVFNLYPIPPLDGSHALSYICQKYGFYKIAQFLDSISRYGMVILILIIATPLSKYFFAPIGFLIELFL